MIDAPPDVFRREDARELGVSRSKLVFAVTLAGLASGVFALSWAPLHGAAWTATPHACAAATICFFLSAAGGVAMMAILRRDCNRLTARLRQTDAPLRATANSLPQAGFSFLQRALSELAESAERAVNDAAFRAKELEVQLKVATAERQHAEAIIYSISDAVLVTDAFDELVLANEAAARTFGFELGNSTRKPLDQVLRDPNLISMIRHARHSDADAPRRVVEHTLHTSAGDRTFKVTLSAVAGPKPIDATDRAAPPAGVVAVMHDMTREKEVAEMKNDFVSMVSHELRTPLASIKAYVEMLIDGEARDDKAQREFYEVIQNEANRLGRLIDNILSIARIESGLVRVTRQPQSLTVIVKDAMEVIAPQAKQKQITLSEKLTPVFYQTSADRDMLHQAVLNLLSNAVKYTPINGSVCAEVDVDEAARKVIVRIIDTGVGIPPKDLPFVFDKFFRAEANSRMASGTGLGLSLVKHIIETVHHGRMLLESQVGKGSVFGFELDLCE
jgi:two-component system phosphate regulon sensor histidine kinase PhoR